MLCSHLTSAFASMSMSPSPSKCNIASMVTQTQMQRLGLNSFFCINVCVAIDTMLNSDGDANAGPNKNQRISGKTLKKNFTFVFVL